MSQAAQQQSPVRILLELARRSRSFAVELPQKLEMVELWNGVAFRIGETNFVAPMDEVSEILHMSPMTRVPNSKAWVLGIANIRGNLLPVMDLAGFLFSNNTKIQKRSRVLVLNHGTVFAGLLVDEVFGMRHFERDKVEKTLPKHDKAITPYIARCYKNDDQYWMVFNLLALVENENFLHAGL